MKKITLFIAILLVTFSSVTAKPIPFTYVSTSHTVSRKFIVNNSPAPFGYVKVKFYSVSEDFSMKVWLQANATLEGYTAEAASRIVELIPIGSSPLCACKNRSLPGSPVCSVYSMDCNCCTVWVCYECAYAVGSSCSLAQKS